MWSLNELYTQLALGFCVSFLSVFFKVTQQQNVIHGRKLFAAINSFIMNANDIAFIGLVVQGGWVMLLPCGTGASIGVVSSMILYPHMTKWFSPKESDTDIAMKMYAEESKKGKWLHDGIESRPPRDPSGLRRNYGREI